MSEKIEIQYNEVYRESSELRSCIEHVISEMEVGYNHVQAQMDDLDSATNARLMAAMERNKKKAYTVAETLDKLLSFIAASSQQVESEEAMIAQVFHTKQETSGGIY